MAKDTSIGGYLPYSFNEWLASEHAPQWLQTESALDEIYKDVIVTLGTGLSSVFEHVESSEGWWQWGVFGNDKTNGLKKQVERTTKLFQSCNLDDTQLDPKVTPAERKGIETTLASLYIVIHSADQMLDKRLCAIHDAWCAVNYKYEGAEKILAKRMQQYIPFADLSQEEKDKDNIWIDAVEKVLK